MEKQLTYSDLPAMVKKKLRLSPKQFDLLPPDKQWDKVVIARILANQEKDAERIKKGMEEAKKENAKLRTFTGRAAWNRILRDRRKM